MNDVDLSKLNISIVGLGLIGGSFAKSIKKNIAVNNLWAIDVNENALFEAEKLKIIDKGFTNPKFPLQNSDIIILCTYPNLTVKFMKDNMDSFKFNAVITDTSGIKQKVVNSVNSFIRDDLEFVGGHPMAGKESNGFSCSDGNVFDDAQYILTPSKNINEKNLNLLKNLFKKLKFKEIILLTPEMHDQIIAFTSHLPHIIACSLINNADNIAKSCIGGSFKDATRVADINAELWSELLIENKQYVLNEAEKFVNNINNLCEIIKSENIDCLKEYLQKSCEMRKEINV